MQYGNGDHRYELVEDWAGLPDDESFLDVGGVCVDGNDDVFVLNRGDHPMMVFDDSGERRATWGDEYFSGRPHGMGLGPEGDVFCTDDGNHTVRKFAPDGELLMTLGTEDEPSETGYRHAEDLFERIASIERGGDPFNSPTSATVLDSGEIFVSDGYGNARVHAFDPEGDLLRSWGEPGPAPGEFRLPHSIEHDEEDRLWVTDRENSRIQIFDAEGEFVEEWTDLIRPTDLAFDGGTVLVSELCNRISAFTTDGELLTRWGNEGHPSDDPLFYAPHTIDVDSNGDLYVGEVSYAHRGVDRGARTLQKFARVA
jgi:DNA-binding beta-propeller fold protein YncE